MRRQHVCTCADTCCLLSMSRFGSYRAHKAYLCNSMHDTASVHTAGLPTHHYALYTDMGMLRLGLTLAQNGVRPEQTLRLVPHPLDDSGRPVPPPEPADPAGGSWSRYEFGSELLPVAVPHMCLLMHKNIWAWLHGALFAWAQRWVCARCRSIKPYPGVCQRTWQDVHHQYGPPPAGDVPGHASESPVRYTAAAQLSMLHLYLCCMMLWNTTC